MPMCDPKIARLKALRVKPASNLKVLCFPNHMAPFAQGIVCSLLTKLILTIVNLSASRFINEEKELCVAIL